MAFMVDYRIPSEASRILLVCKALAQNGHSVYHHLHSVDQRKAHGHVQHPWVREVGSTSFGVRHH